MENHTSVRWDESMAPLCYWLVAEPRKRLRFSIRKMRVESERFLPDLPCSGFGMWLITHRCKENTDMAPPRPIADFGLLPLLVMVLSCAHVFGRVPNGPQEILV